jgi:hypothetical protein
MWNPRIMSKQFVVLLLAVCLFGLPAQAKYGGGTGEPNDPYLIFNADQQSQTLATLLRIVIV